MGHEACNRHCCCDRCARRIAALVLESYLKLGLGRSSGPELTSEHGNGCVCSRGITGQLDAGVLDTRLDENGTNYVEAARAVGYVAKDAQVPCGKVSLH